MNTRTDGYGGDREHRVRLPLEVLAAVRGSTGRDFVVGARSWRMNAWPAARP